MDDSYSVSDLSHQMSSYSIHPRQRHPSSSYYSSTSPSECSSPATGDSTFSLPNFSASATPASSVASSATPARTNSTYHTTNVRAQRQRAVRQQCSSGHLADVAALVSRMVNNGDQCSVCTRSSPPPSSRATPPSESPSYTPIRLARQNSGSSDGSVSPFTSPLFDEDENMADNDEDNQSVETDIVGTPDYFDMPSAPAFGDWSFAWGAGRSKVGESAAERKGCITKDTKSRKQMRRR